MEMPGFLSVQKQTSSFLGRGATALRAQGFSSTFSLSNWHQAFNKTELCQRLAADGQTSAFLQSAPTHWRCGSFFLPAASSLRCIHEDHSKESRGSYHSSQQVLQAKGVFLFLQWMACLESEAEGHWSYPVNKWALGTSFRPCMLSAQHSCDCGEVLQLKDLPCLISQVLPCACSSGNCRQALVWCNEMI